MRTSVFFNTIIIFAGLSGSHGCVCNSPEEKQSVKNDQMESAVTVETMQDILNAFNRHDLDAIMEYFSEDCVFDFPRGPDYNGQRFTGKEQVRKALASRFSGIPDVHYGDDSHWISEAGDRGLSEWTLTGTTTTGIKLKVRGCDLWTFKDGKITGKNSFWKIVEPVERKDR